MLTVWSWALMIKLLFFAANLGGAFSFSPVEPMVGHQSVHRHSSGNSVHMDLLVRRIRDTPRIAFIDRTRIGMAETEDDTDKDDDDESVGQKLRRLIRFPIRRLKRLFKKSKEDESTTSSAETVSEDSSSETVFGDSTPTEAASAGAQTEPTDELSSKEQQKASPRPTQVASEGERSTLSAKSVDLSGEWNIIASSEFREEYDRYLTLLGQPVLVRSVALSIVPLTSEVTEQSEQGKKLTIRGRNVRGMWERALSSTELTNIVTADGEEVEAEAWWEGKGTVHRSWLRGVTKYGGGDFESRRYLESQGKVLVCESTFHPTDPEREAARVTWRFLRQGEKLEDS